MDYINYCSVHSLYFSDVLLLMFVLGPALYNSCLLYLSLHRLLSQTEGNAQLSSFFVSQTYSILCFSCEFDINACVKRGNFFLFFF